MLEPRSAVMILVEASWEDQSGVRHAAPARIEDTSVGGACIRLKSQIRVGSRLRVEWRWEKFSGIAKYCRREGNHYVVGIQRDKSEDTSLDQPLAAPFPAPQAVPSKTAPIPAAQFSNPTQPTERKPSIAVVAQPRRVGMTAAAAAAASAMPSWPASASSAPATRAPAALPAATPGRTAEHAAGAEARISMPQGSEALQRVGLRADQPTKKEKASAERKPMRPKWLEKARWQHKAAPGAIGNGSGEEESEDSKVEKEIHMPPAAPSPTKTTPTAAATAEPASFEIELMSMEDIYRAAGIMIPRKGYSINKVIEMLNSEHIRGLSQEMKRVAVLMALDAAGVAIDDVLQDAKMRQDALSSYEAEQKQRAEAEWAQKMEENRQIEAEIERLTAHHMARINRNLDAVAREQASFGSWQTTKTEAARSMAEAAELCLKPVAESPKAAAASADVSFSGPSSARLI